MNPRLLDRRFSRSMNEVGRTSTRKILAVFSLIGRLIRTLAVTRPTSCIFFITTRPGSFLIDWVLNEILTLARVPIIHYIHTQGFVDLAARGRIWDVLVRRLLGNAQMTICLGPSLVPDVSAWVKGQLICIPNTTSGSPTAGVKNHEDHPQKVLFLSNLIPSKGPEDFIEMALHVRRNSPAAVLQIVGADSDPEFTFTLKSRAAQLGLDHCLQFLGPKYGEDKWLLLQDATVLIYPSHYDAQPLTILEAFSCSTPVIAYRTGGIPDLISSDVNGYLVDPGDLEALAGHCNSILSDVALRKRLKESALLSYLEDYSLAAYEASWQSAMRSAFA
ncbi:glycosyltransferase involved in cell wall biosynthesis [Cryobacterium psychrophilum]|nr:glycosyltransferase involved in cell wall biosynthesis [Cryobacterium psychrophilum]